MAGQWYTSTGYEELYDVKVNDTDTLYILARYGSNQIHFFTMDLSDFSLTQT